MAKYFEIEDPSQPGSCYGITDGTCEYANPIYYCYQAITNIRLRYAVTMLSDDQNISKQVMSVLKNKFLSEWQEHKKNVLNHKLPLQFHELFSTIVRKKDQKKLLRNFVLTMDDFEALIYQSWETYGFKFSKYVFHHDPVEFANHQKPLVTFKKSHDDIRKVGETNLTDNQLRALINMRNVVVANFFDKGDEWHCLFLTHKGISGKELDHIAVPHMHYISSSFGLHRSEVIEKFRQTRYSLDSIHIPFNGYNPMAEENIIEKADF